MTVIRHGNPLGLWDGATTYDSNTNLSGGVNVPMGAASAIQEIGRGSNSLSVYLRIVGNPGFQTIWQMQGAHSGGMNIGGQPVDAGPSTLANTGAEPVDRDQITLVWHDAWYYGMVPTTAAYGTQGATNLQFWMPTTGGAVVNFVPDWVSGWLRLARVDAVNTPVTVVAGWEAQSE